MKYKVEVIVCWNILLCRRNECKVIVTYRLFFCGEMPKYIEKHLRLDYNIIIDGGV